MLAVEVDRAEQRTAGVEELPGCAEAGQKGRALPRTAALSVFVHVAAVRLGRQPPWEADRFAAPVYQPDASDASQVWRMLAVLSASEREVVVLRVIVGLTVTDTCEVLGQNPGWVRFKQAHALATLRRLIAAWD